MKLIVCGGRKYQERAAQFRAMDEIHATTPITLVIHGACTDRETKKLTGADRWAEEWAIEREVPYMGVPARWTKEGRSAGPRRNGRMAAIRNVDMVLAMPGEQQLILVSPGSDKCPRRAQ